MYVCTCGFLGHPGGRKVEVRYVDFGNESTVFVSDLRKLKDEFFALPIMVRRLLTNVVCGTRLFL